MIDMFMEIVKFCLFEKINKRIIKSLPYHILVSTILLELDNYVNIKCLNLEEFTLGLTIFLLTSLWLSFEINGGLEIYIINTNIKDFRIFVSKILDGDLAIIDIFKLLRDRLSIVVMSILNGLSFAILVVLTIYSTLKFFQTKYFNNKYTIIIILQLFLILYILQDIFKSGILETEIEIETGENDNRSLVCNLVEQFIYKNTLNKITKASIFEYFFKLLYRLVGSVFYLNVPKIKYDSLLLYLDNNIKNIILEKESKNGEIIFKHADGFNLTQFFLDESCERITILLEKSSKEVFSYLFDPEYTKEQDKKKRWTILKILKKEDNRIYHAGYLIIHMFKGVKVKRKVKIIKKTRIRNRIEFEPKYILLFMFFGREDVVQRLKLEFELNSVKVDHRTIELEYEL